MIFIVKMKKRKRGWVSHKIESHPFSKTEESVLNFIFGVIQISIFFALCFLLASCFV